MNHTTCRLAPLLALMLGVAQAQTTVASQTATEPSLRYTVLAKDTLIGFSNDVLVSPKAWPEVARFNALPNPNVISVGQQINVPLRLLKHKAEGVKVLSTSGDVNVAAGASLAEGQPIKVGANSSAVIELADKSRVKMGPGTLAEVLKNRNYPDRGAAKSLSDTWYAGLMRVVQGQIEVLATKTERRAEPLRVQLPTAVVGVRGTVFRAGVLGNNATTEVLQGRVQADNSAQGTGAPVGAGFGALIDPTQREVKAVALLAAPNFAGVSSELVKPAASFNFAPVPGAVAYRVQVASDADFNNLVQDSKTSSAQANLSGLALGGWHVRARGIDTAGLEGFDGAIRVALKAAPVVIAVPALPMSPLFAPLVMNRAQLSARQGQTWLTLPALDANHTQLHVQLAADAQFSKVLLSQALVAQQVNLGALAQGSYFVRVTGVDAQNRNNSSPVYRLELDANWGETVLNQSSPLEPVGR